MKKVVLLFILGMLLSVNSVFAGDIDIDYNNGIYHIVLKGDKIKRKVKFIASESLITNREAHFTSKSKLTINAGFFDPNNSKTISYIVSEQNTEVDPLLNENLLNNPFLRKNLDKIINRTEFRVLDCDNKYRYEIVPHKTAVDFSCNLITSAQGGPLILPELRLEEEYFIVKDKDGNIVRESASVLHKVPRTIIGIKDNDAHILIITDENPMDMYEVQKLCSKFGFDRAMAFDGGSSTSLNYKKDIEVVSTVGDGGGRMLKSFMIVK